MKKYSFIGIFALVSLLVAGCSLDTSPAKQLDGEKLTDGDVETLTLGSLAFMKEDNGVMRAYHYIGEFGGDNISLSGTTTDPLMYIYNYNRITTSTRVGYLWSYGYRTIISLNGTIERIPEGESFEKDYLIGENLYLRAYHYLLLVSAFGRPYVDNPTQNLGVPVKLTTSMEDFPARHTVAQVYDQIVADLEKAIGLMTIPTGSVFAANDNSRPSKEVAEALLSRVYLYMENWEKAEEYASNVIDSGRYGLLTGNRFATYPTFNPSENEETIFAVKFNRDDKKYMPAYMLGSMYTTVQERGWGEMYPSHPYLMLLDRFPDDLRHAYIDKQESEAGGYWFIYQTGGNAYATVDVLKDDENYTLIEQGSYSSPEVGREVYRGGNRFYLTLASGARVYGRVEEKCQMRNSWPKYFMNKLVLQEYQADLYSPVVSRLAEMYLNRAEARFHLGDADGAVADVNVIRNRAGIPTWSMSANPGSGEVSIPEDYPLLELILDERRLELAFEAHRRLDIYRNRQTLDRNYPGGHITSNGPTTLDYTDDRIVEYIPEKEIQAYPNPDLLIQNP